MMTERDLRTQSSAEALAYADRTRVLVVTEDPFFLEEVNEELKRLGAVVTGCLGPAQSFCELDDGEFCPLAAHAGVVIVDPPATGTFSRHHVSIPVGAYAARLAAAHPDRLILLAGTPQVGSGGTGDAVAVADRETAVCIARYSAMARSTDAPLPLPTEGRRA